MIRHYCWSTRWGEPVARPSLGCQPPPSGAHTPLSLSLSIGLDCLLASCRTRPSICRLLCKLIQRTYTTGTRAIVGNLPYQLWNPPRLLSMGLGSHCRPQRHILILALILLQVPPTLQPLRLRLTLSTFHHHHHQSQPTTRVTLTVSYHLLRQSTLHLTRDLKLSTVSPVLRALQLPPLLSPLPLSFVLRRANPSSGSLSPLQPRPWPCAFLPPALLSRPPSSSPSQNRGSQGPSRWTVRPSTSSPQPLALRRWRASEYPPIPTDMCRSPFPRLATHTHTHFTTGNVLLTGIFPS